VRGRTDRDADNRPSRNYGVMLDITGRKRAEKALQTTTQRFHSTLSSLYGGILLLTNGGEVEFANQSFCDLFGLEEPPRNLIGLAPDALLGKIRTRYGNPEEAVSRIREIVGCGLPVKNEEVTLSGSRTCLRDFIPIKLGGASHGRVWHHIDITDRKRAEEALHESEERYRSLFNSMSEGFALHEIVVDEKGKACDYRFLDVNPAFEKLTGLKRENLLGRLMREVLPEEDPAWVTAYGRVALTGEPVHFENYSPALQRWYEVFSYRPAPLRFAVIFMDITERKQAQQALHQSHEELERRVEDRTAELLQTNAALLDKFE
jgi:PAS domain S-box-containing protein